MIIDTVSGAHTEVGKILAEEIVKVGERKGAWVHPDPFLEAMALGWLVA